jgi:hypothetical protein
MNKAEEVEGLRATLKSQASQESSFKRALAWLWHWGAATAAGPRPLSTRHRKCLSSTSSPRLARSPNPVSILCDSEALAHAVSNASVLSEHRPAHSP